MRNAISGAVVCLCLVFCAGWTSDTPPGFSPVYGASVTKEEFQTQRFAIDWARRVEQKNRKADFDKCVFPAWKETVREHKVNEGKKAIPWLIEKWKYGMMLEGWLMDHERERKRMESE